MLLSFSSPDGQIYFLTTESMHDLLSVDSFVCGSKVGVVVDCCTKSMRKDSYFTHGFFTTVEVASGT